MKQDMPKQLYKAEYTPEAVDQLKELSFEYRAKIIEAIGIFEKVGKLYKNINDLGSGLFEIKPKGVRAYFMYDNNRRRIIIIGFICLKKTQEAPKRYMKQAKNNIKKYMESEQ